MNRDGFGPGPAQGPTDLGWAGPKPIPIYGRFDSVGKTALIFASSFPLSMSTKKFPIFLL